MLTADDLRLSLSEAPLTCGVLAQLLNAKDYCEAGRLLMEQAESAKLARLIIRTELHPELDKETL